MLRKLIFSGLAVAVVLPATGCRSCSKNKRGSDVPPPPPPGAGSPFLDAPLPSGGDRIPPPPYPSGGDRIPPPSVPVPSGGGGSFPPPEVPDSRGSYRFDPLYPSAIPAAPAPSPAATADRPPPPLPPATTPPPPAKSNRELLLPDPLPGAGAVAQVPPDSVSAPPPATSGYLDEPIRPPSPVRSSNASPPPATTDDRPPPATSSAPAASGATPVGVPGYSPVSDKPGVFTGRRPTVDGFEALKSAGIRTVVYLHGPDADVTAAKSLAERNGLRFEPVAVSPETLPRATATFNALVANKAARPLFVSDDTGARAGILWFLYFRTVDLLGSDAARVRAAPLGLRDAGSSDEMTRYWVAAQDYLSKR